MPHWIRILRHRAEGALLCALLSSLVAIAPAQEPVSATATQTVQVAAPALPAPKAAGIPGRDGLRDNWISASNASAVRVVVDWPDEGLKGASAFVTLSDSKKKRVQSPAVPITGKWTAFENLDASALKDGHVSLTVTVLRGPQSTTWVGPRIERVSTPEPLVANDAVVLGILLVILAAVFTTSSSTSRFWKRFYTFIPSLLLCYFIPSILTNLGVISPKVSGLYPVARDYLLPSSLVLLTLSIDLPGVLRLGPKALIMFFAATFGIVIGGPLAILLTSSFWPEAITPDLWRGMSTVAGSWIGGGANQAAMKEVYEVSDEIFGAFVAVDVLVANVWMAGLLTIAARSKQLDRWIKADSTAITDLEQRIEKYQSSIRRHPTTPDLMGMCALAFGVTAIGHLVADNLVPWLKSLEIAEGLGKIGFTSKFFWIVVTATTGAIALSFTRLRRFEGAGASRLGSVLLYILVATIGMKMDLRAIGRHPELFVVGGIWMSIHVGTLFLVARLVRSPMFFLAVGSKANIGGAASAPIVASAFNPVLAPVGVLLAVVGYALGTYAAVLTAVLMELVTNNPI